MTIDSSIRLSASSLPSATLEQILAALTIPNPEKATAIREMLWGAKDLPDDIYLYSRNGDELTLPRGFYGQLVQGLSAYGMEAEWIDYRRDLEFFPLTKEPDPETGFRLSLDPIRLRDYQSPAVKALVEYEQGVLEMQTGGGKTSVCLEAIRQVNQPALIIVDKASLAEQWRERIRKQLGAQAGYIGESITDVRPITVALRQSLWARFDELSRPQWNLLDLVEGNFWDLWAVVAVDEVHHVVADTLSTIVQQFPARRRWGLSATPRRDPELWPLTQAVIGPVIHRTGEEELGGALVKPTVHVLRSDFEFDYRPTQMLDKVDPMTGMTIISQRTRKPVQMRIQNNYGDMVKTLCADDHRNSMIVAEIERLVDEERHVLVVSRRKQQLRNLSSRMSGVLVQELYGGESGDRKREVEDAIEQAESGSVLLSTVAEEGLDIPRLDVVFIVFPMRNPEVFKQIVGRVMRPHPSKTRADVYDVCDERVGLLKDQFRERRNLLYVRSRYEVVDAATIG